MKTARSAVSTIRVRHTRSRAHSHLDELLACRRLLAASLRESPLLIRHRPERERPDEQRAGQARCADANHAEPDDADGVAKSSLHLASQRLSAESDDLGLSFETCA